MQEAADFKSDVSTNFTIRASSVDDTPNENSPDNVDWRDCGFGIGIDGGATRSRTGLDGFAIRCITALLSRHSRCRDFEVVEISEKKGSLRFPFSKLEREKSLELSTSTLARLRSTN
jgi:hypothetical protein